MVKAAGAVEEFGYVTRREPATRFGIPPRVVDQWIATGQITAMRISVFGRGGQRVFYSAADAKRLVREKPLRKRKARVTRRT